MLLIQNLENAQELMSVGENASVTTIGVMAVLCLILIAGIIAIWRDRVKTEKEQKALDRKTLEALTTANVVLANIDIEVKGFKEKLSDVNTKLVEVIAEIKNRR